MSAFLRPMGRAARRGFTLIELLMVITIILLLAGVFLSLRPGNGGGLPAGQKMLGSSIQSVRAMALMNRGSFASNVTYGGRYRLLILKDETDPVNHLRQFCIAIGSVIPPTGVDPATITDTTNINYKWYAPEAPSLLPPNIFFIPPLVDSAPAAAITAPPLPNGGAGTWSAGMGHRSVLPAIADNSRSSLPDAANSPPTMKFEPVNQPTALTAAPHTNGKLWYYVELQPSGASNHLGKVVLVLAAGSARVQASGKVAIDCDNINQFAAISLRPNGSVSYTSDPDELDTTTSTSLYK